MSRYGRVDARRRSEKLHVGRLAEPDDCTTRRHVRPSFRAERGAERRANRISIIGGSRSAFDGRPPRGETRGVGLDEIAIVYRSHIRLFSKQSTERARMAMRLTKRTRSNRLRSESTADAACASVRSMSRVRSCPRVACPAKPHVELVEPESGNAARPSASVTQ